MIKKIFCVLFLVMPISSFQEKRSFLSAEGPMELEQFYKDKQVLITGGAGFIGSHLAQKLVELGARVTILDDLSTGFLKNIQTFKDNVTFIEKSIIDKTVCDQAVTGKEVVFHLAAYTSVPGSIADPTLCHQINIDGTFNLLDASRKHHVKRFVFSSSSAVYGPRNSACIENDLLNPISPYGSTKLMGELYCKQFMLNFNVPCVYLRYFNVYGPRQNPNSQYAAVVAKFLQQLEANKPVTIFGDGSQTRDFVSVANVVEANLIAGMAQEKKVNGHAFNIGNGKAITILELAQALKKDFVEYDQEIQFLPARDGDVKHTLANVNKFKNLLTTFP